MDENLFMDIKLFIESHLHVNSALSFNNWFDKELYYLENEKVMLQELSEFLIQKYNIFYTEEDLFSMMKFFLLYPKEIPVELRYLPWEILKILLNIFEEEKREFYIWLCFEKNLDVATLNKYLQEDLYEKFLYCFHNYYHQDSFAKEEYSQLLDYVIVLLPRIV